jgi:hypothetical protein
VVTRAGREDDAVFERGKGRRTRKEVVVATRGLVMGVLLACSASALAAEWVRVGADAETEHFVDAASFVRDGDVVRVTKRAIYRDPQPIGGTAGMPLIKESVGVVEDDCVRAQHRVVSIQLFSDDGRVIWASGDMKRIWEGVEPGSAGQATLDYVCAAVAQR